MHKRVVRLPNNAPGRYFVNSRCIDCDVCRDIAPNNFKRDVAQRTAFVYQQPRNQMEESLCREALEACPVEAIADNQKS